MEVEEKERNKRLEFKTKKIKCYVFDREMFALKYF